MIFVEPGSIETEAAPHQDLPALSEPESPQAIIEAPPVQPEPVPTLTEESQVAPVKAKPSFMETIRSLLVSPEAKEIQTLDFDPGVLDDPSLEGSLRDVNITYRIDPPYQYVHIEYNKQEVDLIYSVVEPLSEDEKVALDIIEQAFEKLVSTNLEIIEGDRWTEYLRERFYSLVNIFGLKLTEHQKERMFFVLKRQYLGYTGSTP